MATERNAGLKASVVQEQRRTRGRYPANLRRQLIEQAKSRWAEGASMRAVAEELGVSVHTLSYWRAVEGIGKKRAKVRRVEIVAAPVTRTIVAAGPHGLRMQLTLDDAAELLRKLG
jgi:transposase-like protein